MEPKDNHLKLEKARALRKRAEEKLWRKMEDPGELSVEEIQRLVHELRVYQIELEMQNEELRTAQIQLEESRNRYSNLYDFAPVGYFTLDQSGFILEVNLKGASQLGVEKRFLIKTPFPKYVATEDQDTFYLYCRRVFAGEPGQTCEVKILNPPKGIQFYAQLEGLLVKDPAGQEVCRITVMDITERKRVEQALIAEKERLAATLRSIGDGVIVADAGGRVVLINNVAERLTGWTQEAAMGEPLPEVFYIVHDKTRQRLKGPVEKVLKTGDMANLADPALLVAKDGTERVISSNCTPLYDKQGHRIGTVLVFRDITEKQKIEEERLRASKLESIGTLAGGIAHDFNNILTIIMGHLSLAMACVSPEEEIFKRLAVAKKASLRAKDLAQQLLTFSRGGAPIKKTTSLTELIKESAAFALKGSNVRCEFFLPEDLWPVEVDAVQMNQVIHNLVLNAQQAMPEEGVLKIRGENIEIAAKGSSPRPPLPEGKYIKISLEDQGVGISQEHLPKIFDPYFTTKEKGTGLGLATTYFIIKRHEGYIDVESALGVGTTFHIYLPASQKQLLSEKDPVEGDSNTPPGAYEGRILVMDDEEAIRSMLGQMLNYMGYKVEFATNGEEATHLYRRAQEAGHPFDVVILDLIVPGGMGGRKTIQKLREIDPRVKAIVSSGYSNDLVLADFRRYGFQGVVAKPYGIEGLRKILSKVIKGIRE